MMKKNVIQMFQILEIQLFDEFGLIRDGVNSEGACGIKNENQDLEFLFNVANIMFITLLQFRMLRVSRFEEKRNTIITRCDKFWSSKSSKNGGQVTDFWTPRNGV